MSLESFIMSYLNVDFDLIDGTPSAGIKAFLVNQPAAEVRAAREELADLLAATRGNDVALLDAVYALGCGLVADGEDMRRLLEDALELWSRAAATAV